MTPKKLITQIKDYADCTDASYAMLHFVEQNEKIDYSLDKLRSENPNESVRPPARWLYADGIKQGYEITKDNTTGLTDKNNRQIGEPTAYALAIEARFSQNMKIQKPKADNPNELDKPQEINNKIQSFIYRKKEDKEAKDQKILVAINKEQAKKMIIPTTSPHALKPLSLVLNSFIIKKIQALVGILIHSLKTIKQKI